MLKALIFDVDGTLADTEKAGHLVAFNQAFKDFGLPWSWNDSLYKELLLVTGGKERLRHYIGQAQPELLNHFYVNELVSRLHQYKNQRYADLVRQGKVGLRPGVRRLLFEARQTGIKLAIATTTSRENILALLQATLGPKALHWFDSIITAEDVQRKKPDKEVYLRALEQLGLQAWQCLAFEDAANGLQASKGAGIATIITRNQYTQNHDFTDALVVLDHLGDPDAGATVLEGQALKHTHVDVPQLIAWHQIALKRQHECGMEHRAGHQENNTYHKGVTHGDS